MLYGERGCTDTGHTSSIWKERAARRQRESKGMVERWLSRHAWRDVTGQFISGAPRRECCKARLCEPRSSSLLRRVRVQCKAIHTDRRLHHHVASDQRCPARSRCKRRTSGDDNKVWGVTAILVLRVNTLCS